MGSALQLPFAWSSRASARRYSTLRSLRMADCSVARVYLTSTRVEVADCLAAPQRLAQVVLHRYHQFLRCLQFIGNWGVAGRDGRSAGLRHRASAGHWTAQPQGQQATFAVDAGPDPGSALLPARARGGGVIAVTFQPRHQAGFPLVAGGAGLEVRRWRVRSGRRGRDRCRCGTCIGRGRRRGDRHWLAARATRFAGGLFSVARRRRLGRRR